MSCLSISLVSEGRRNITVSGCVVVRLVISALAVLLCIAFCIALVPGVNSWEILCFIICWMRSLFILRSAAPLASFLTLLAVHMVERRDLRSSLLGWLGRMWSRGLWAECLRSSWVE